MSWHMLGAIGFALLAVGLFIIMLRRIWQETRVDFHIGSRTVSIVGALKPGDIDQLVQAMQEEIPFPHATSPTPIQETAKAQTPQVEAHHASVI